MSRFQFAGSEKRSDIPIRSGQPILLARLLPWLPLWLAPLVLFSPVWLAGKAIFWGTVSLQFVPWQAFAWESLKNGSLPLWNPLVGMGAPLAANYQSALFYPPNWLLYPLYLAGGVEWQVWGQGLLAAIHLGWAATGMALLARRLGVSVLGQVVGGLAYGLSGYLVSRSGFLSINAAAAWTPWVLLGGWRLCASASSAPGGRGGLLALGRRGIPLAAGVGMLLLAGHAQTAWYTLLLLVVCGAFWGLQSGGPNSGGGRLGHLFRTLLLLGLFCALGAALAAVQLLPTGEYLLQSQRATAVDYDFAMTYSFWPPRFLTLFAPDFFGNPARGDYSGYGNFWEDHLYLGLLPLLLALAAAGAGLRALLRRKGAEGGQPGFLTLLGAVVVVSFLLALGRHTPVFPWLYRHIPTFDMFQAPTRFSLWAEFSLALLAAFGAGHWRRPRGRALYWTRLGTAGAFAISLGAAAAALLFPGVSPAFLRAMALASLFGVGAGLLSLTAPQAGGSGSGARVWRLAVISLVGLDLVVAGWGLNPAIERDFYRAPAPNASAVQALAGEGRLYISPEDEYTLKYERFMHFQSFDPGEAWTNLRAALLPNLNLLDGLPSANQFDPLVPGRYQRWMDALGTAPEDEKGRWLNFMNVTVVENINPQQEIGIEFTAVESGPRARWVPCARPGADEAGAWKAVHEGGFDPLQFAVIEGNTPPAAASSLAPGCRPEARGEAQILAAAPDRITLRTAAGEPGWLVLSDLGYPGWQARVDGEAAPVLQANYLFRAVFLEPGEHQVEFLYRPVTFKAGAALSLAALLGLALWWWSGRRGGESLPA